MIRLFLSHAFAGSSFMPPEGSKVAGYVDGLYAFLLWASLISCVFVIGGFVFFAIKYRRKFEGQTGAYISHNNVLEFAWSFIPFVVFMIVFGWGWWVYKELRTSPKEAMEVHVFAQQWSWEFVYLSGRKVSNEFYVPVDTPVKLIMTSRDVIHSFYIPAFRTKQDVVPGRYSATWFQANKVGDYQVFCTEYCGMAHSSMLAKIHVVTRKQYEEWLEKDPYKGLDLAQIGQKIYSAKCSVCHNTTLDRKVGPGFANIFGKEREFDDGKKLIADENYIRESILQPNAKVVKGFPRNVMPIFAGQLNEQELSGVVTYLKTLKN